MARKVRGFKRKLPNGSFSKTLYVDYVYRGVRVNRDTGCQSAKELPTWVAGTNQQIDQKLAGALRPLTAEHRNLTVLEALTRYWDQKLRFSRSAKSEQYLLSRLADMLGAETKFVDIRTGVIMERVIVPLKRRGLTARSINRELDILKAAHRWAQEVWEVEDLPTIAWRRLHQKAPVRLIKAPTVEQIRSLHLNASPRLQPVIQMAVLTGLRLSEIRGLRPKDVDLSAGTMTLIGKGNKEAKLPLSSAAISLLSSMLRENSSQLFDMKNFRKEWDAARTLSGTPDIRFHDLRHAFATLLAANGMGAHGVQKAMRHSDIATQLIYVDADKLLVLPHLDRLAEVVNFDVSPNLLTDESNSSQPSKSPTSSNSAPPSTEE